MTSNNSKFKMIALISALFYILNIQAQSETSLWKFQIGFGINSPGDNIKNDVFKSKGLNFPSINLGIQHMFDREYGAKFDFGYNRAVNDDNSPEFKFNYSRVNVQFVYDFTSIMPFLPQRTAVIGHVGPGLSFTKPLGSYSDNTYTYLNALGGLEFHVGVAQTVSIYADFSYILALSGKDKYDPAADGFSFNGDLTFITVGVSVSLSGCYFCD